MRPNVDVLRDVLLFVEKKLEVEYDSEDGGIKSSNIDPYDLLDRLDENRHSKRKPEEILYAVRMLRDSGLVNKCVTIGAQGDWTFSDICDLTFAGHEFLETVRDSTTWGKTKEIAKKAGCQAVIFLSQVASTVISEAINGKL